MSDPADADLRSRFEPRLLAELEGLVADGNQTRADRAPVTLDQQSVGRLSRMDALQGQAMAQAMQGRRAGRARAIRAALDRMGHGAFGWCEDCGDFIGDRRLDLDPTLPRCIGCSR